MELTIEEIKVIKEALEQYYTEYATEDEKMIIEEISKKIEMDFLPL